MVANDRSQRIVSGVGAGQGKRLGSTRDKANAARAVEIDRSSAGSIDRPTAAAEGEQPVRGCRAAGIPKRSAATED